MPTCLNVSTYSRAHKSENMLLCLEGEIDHNALGESEENSVRSLNGRGVLIVCCCDHECNNAGDISFKFYFFPVTSKTDTSVTSLFLLLLLNCSVLYFHVQLCQKTVLQILKAYNPTSLRFVMGKAELLWDLNPSRFHVTLCFFRLVFKAPPILKLLNILKGIFSYELLTSLTTGTLHNFCQKNLFIIPVQIQNDTLHI